MNDPYLSFSSASSFKSEESSESVGLIDEFEFDERPKPKTPEPYFDPETVELLKDFDYTCP